MRTLPMMYKKIVVDTLQNTATYHFNLLLSTTLQQKMGINLIDITYGTYIGVEASLFLSPLIIVGHIDSMYSDRSYADNCITSFAVTIKEFLKGDTSVKNIIIRDNNGAVEYDIMREKKSYRPFNDAGLRLNEGGDYLLILFKHNYEREIEQALLAGDIIQGKQTQNCYRINTELLPIYPSTSSNFQPRIASKISTIRTLCKKYAPVFPFSKTKY
jgi:hypothetical protein